MTERVKSFLVASVVVVVLVAAVAIMVVRWVQVKLEPARADGKTYISVSSVFGGTEWPPPKKVQTVRDVADGRVFDAFCAAHPEIGFNRKANLKFQEGRANESAVLMAQAGRTAGEVLYVNFRTIDSFVRQKFLVPLDGYILQLARDEIDRRLTDGLTRLRDGNEVAQATRELLDPANPRGVKAVQDPRFNPAWVDLHPAVWDTVYRPDPDDPRVRHVYAFPYDQVTMALNYRKDIFKARAEDLLKAGLDPDRGPATWEELLEYAYALTDPAGGIYGYYLPRHGWQISNFIWQAGSEIVERDDNDQWSVVWDRPQTVQAVQFIRKLLTTDKTVTLPDGKTQRTMKVAQVLGTGTQDFREGRCAMVYEYTSDLALTYGTMDPAVLGMSPMPAGPVKCPATQAAVRSEPGVTLFQKHGRLWVRFADGSEAPESGVVRVRDRGGREAWRIAGNELNAPMWGINAVATDQRRRDAAWQLIRFYGSKTAQKIRTQAYIEAGWSKYVHPARLAEFGFTEYLQDVDPQWRQTSIEAYLSGRPEPNGKNCRQIYFFIFPTFERFALINKDRDKQARNELNDAGLPAYNLDAGGDQDHKDILKSLQQDVDQAGRIMLGRYTPEQQTRDRRRASYVVAAIALVMGGGFWWMIRGLRRAFSPPGEVVATGQKATVRVHAIAWAFLSLAVVSVVVWMYYPLLRGAGIAFQDYSVVEGGRWAGMKNFVEVFNSDLFLKALLNTFVYVALGLLLGFFTPIFLAILLDEIPRGKLFFRTVYYLPAVMSGLVVAYLWRWMYDPNPTGAINQLLISLHIIDQKEAIGWLTSPHWAMLSVIIPLVWAGAGPGCIIYLAALKSIPEEIYEAADIDGAGAWKKIFHITLPYLKPLVIINFVGAFIGTFKSWQNIFVMTGGGPDNATHVIGMEVWYNAFVYLKFGYATAVAWIIGSILIGFTLYQLRILKNMRFTTARRA